MACVGTALERGSALRRQSRQVTHVCRPGMCRHHPPFLRLPQQACMTWAHFTWCQVPACSLPWRTYERNGTDRVEESDDEASATDILISFQNSISVECFILSLDVFK